MQSTFGIATGAGGALGRRTCCVAAAGACG
ncbi:unnamed protein product [Spirodela intermedia]|uniref:Uncharacterized protein n=1 Tax=Spirodela intermedia TaxID=51605 RepID=A0A7I8I992_SPIIN|nr:unnamed protein product [Spirodela intermedia]CAA6654180.1 unnamed protein product [Spirodela intermedia]